MALYAFLGAKSSALTSCDLVNRALKTNIEEKKRKVESGKWKVQREADMHKK
jgi:hypothetical protein